MSTPTPTYTSAPSGPTLSPGSIAGVTIGGVAVAIISFLVIGSLIECCYRHRKNKQRILISGGFNKQSRFSSNEIADYDKPRRKLQREWAKPHDLEKGPSLALHIEKNKSSPAPNLGAIGVAVSPDKMIDISPASYHSANSHLDFLPAPPQPTLQPGFSRSSDGIKPQIENDRQTALLSPSKTAFSRPHPQAYAMQQQRAMPHVVDIPVKWKGSSLLRLQNTSNMPVIQSIPSPKHYPPPSMPPLCAPPPLPQDAKETKTSQTPATNTNAGRNVRGNIPSYYMDQNDAPLFSLSKSSGSASITNSKKTPPSAYKPPYTPNRDSMASNTSIETAFSEHATQVNEPSEKKNPSLSPVTESPKSCRRPSDQSTLRRSTRSISSHSTHSIPRYSTSSSVYSTPPILPPAPALLPTHERSSSPANSLLEKRRGHGPAQGLEKGLWITDSNTRGPTRTTTSWPVRESSTMTNGPRGAVQTTRRAFESQKSPMWNPKLTPKRVGTDMMFEVSSH